MHIFFIRSPVTYQSAGWPRAVDAVLRMHLRLFGGVEGCANSPREPLGSALRRLGEAKKGCLLAVRNAEAASRRGYDRAAARGATPLAMAIGRIYGFLAATACAHDPRIGAEERGLVTRLNRRYRGGLCFKAFIRWPKLGRERARGRAEIDFHAIDAASAHWLMPHRFASARSKSG